MSMRRKALGVIGVVVLGLAAGGGAAPAKLRVLLLSGANNHDWKTTTPALVKLLDESGRFAVTVTDEPAKLDAASFARYDVIVSNWTPWPNVKQRIWDAATEKAFVDFIRGGGGLVVFHAASTAFAGWEEFRHMACGTWGKGTGHGPRHEFTVTIADKAHPITAGMADFAIFDELWHRTALHPKAKVLCTALAAKDRRGTGEDEPVAVYTRFGKGRGFYLVLGHDVRAMSAAGWRTLMLRGTEWAATGKVTISLAAGGAGGGADLDAALKAIFDYKFGQSRKPLAAVEKLISAAATDPVRRRKAAAA
ncbi:MAG: ThuA domain-containing protein, partial [Phycisphaerae bacterium]